MKLQENVLTRFVIVEKYFSFKYHTPIFDFYGNRFSIFSSVGRFFGSPGVYTIERDFAILEEIVNESEQKKFSMDLVPKPGFEGFEIGISENNIISLFKEKNGKYRDTS
jgi:hypothetical protein